MTEIDLPLVYKAMEAAGRAPDTLEGMATALATAGLPYQPVHVDVALGAYRNSYTCESNRELAMRKALEAVAMLMKPKSARAAVRPAEVEQALRAMVEREPSPTGWQVDSRVIRQLADTLGFDASAEERAYRRQEAERRFSGQVSRAFGKLVDQGVLRKAGQGTKGPDGREVYRNSVAYYTPEVWATIAARTEAKRETEAEVADRWAAVYSQLVALGMESTGLPGRPVRLELEDFERLAELAVTGKAVIAGDAP
jgi:hypothetical protein